MEKGATLPLTESALPVWAKLAPLALVGGLLGLVAIGAPIAYAGPAAGLALPLWAVAAAVLVWAVRARRWREHVRAARELGLRPDRRAYREDLALGRGMHLFAVTDRGSRRAGYRMEGEIDGLHLLLFRYRHAGYFRTVEDRQVARRGEQTVFLVRPAGGLPDFRLAPAGERWDELIEGRLWALHAGEAVVEVETDGPPALARSRDERAIRDLFERPEALGPLAGWVVECRRGVLLFYRDRKVIPPDELSHYLYQVVRIAASLRAAALLAAEGPSGPGAR